MYGIKGGSFREDPFADPWSNLFTTIEQGFKLRARIHFPEWLIQCLCRRLGAESSAFGLWFFGIRAAGDMARKVREVLLWSVVDHWHFLRGVPGVS